MARQRRLESQLEPEPGRLAFQTRSRRLRPSCGCEVAALPDEREKLGAPLCVLMQLLVLLVDAPKLGPVAPDLGLEFDAATALPPVKALELALRGCEFLGPALA